MRRVAICTAALWFLAPGAALAAGVVHHDLSVTIEPAAHTLSVRDRLTFPAPPAGEVVVTLHPGLNPSVEEAGARLEEAGGDAGFSRYRLTLPAGATAATIAYRGAIDHPLEQVGEEYARGQQETRGTISEAGVFLTGASGWYPALPGGGTLTFALAVDLPEGWDAVSQGSRAAHEVAGGRRRVRWACLRCAGVFPGHGGGIISNGVVATVVSGGTNRDGLWFVDIDASIATDGNCHSGQKAIPVHPQSSH